MPNGKASRYSIPSPSNFYTNLENEPLIGKLKRRISETGSETTSEENFSVHHLGGSEVSQIMLSLANLNLLRLPVVPQNVLVFPDSEGLLREVVEVIVYLDGHEAQRRTSVLKTIVNQWLNQARELVNPVDHIICIF